ncbi:fungal protein [Schizosaccharomyces cryophilus OY26]|uniref:Fungal protein n=1 Tax=Schizosaccharomyces cryophilus (strain OY26 / ATCC MYA-4695 / CBS 11777 / NBRC 106824 / NRRL Y48691) TaxID=653667 RepID=S9X6X4_SCHCR|nr:uncharacterized protein SPOG_01411 [Schizosaccharomyces cryophilus OY26]EPY49526.1 fungal protein [Schizosaccharomyces cryophilus OY26]
MLFVVDFDETITAHDTISCIAEAANKPDLWSFLAKAYWDEYLSWRSGLPKLTTLSSYLDLLRKGGFAEAASIQRIQKHKFFEGLTPEQLEGVASSITLRDGFDKFLQLLMPRLRDGTDEFHILSINWSSRVIEATLRRIPDIDTGLITIHSNDLEMDPTNQLTTGKIVPFHAESLILTADDKAREFQTLVRSSPYNATVYIGDSSTDFGCFSHASISILFLATEKILFTLESFSDVRLLKLDASYDLSNTKERPQFNPSPLYQSQSLKAQSLSQTKIYTCDQWHIITAVFRR